MIPHVDILKNLNENLIKKSNKKFIFEFNDNPIKPKKTRAEGWVLLKNGSYIKKFDFFSKDFLCNFGKEVFDYMNNNIMIDYSFFIKKDQCYIVLGSKEMITDIELNIARDLNEIYKNLKEEYKKDEYGI